MPEKYPIKGLSFITKDLIGVHFYTYCTADNAKIQLWLTTTDIRFSPLSSTYLQIGNFCVFGLCVETPPNQRQAQINEQLNLIRQLDFSKLGSDTLILVSCETSEFETFIKAFAGSKGIAGQKIQRIDNMLQYCTNPKVCFRDGNGNNIDPEDFSSRLTAYLEPGIAHASGQVGAPKTQREPAETEHWNIEQCDAKTSSKPNLPKEPTVQLMSAALVIGIGVYFETNSSLFSGSFGLGIAGIAMASLVAAVSLYQIYSLICGKSDRSTSPAQVSKETESTLWKHQRTPSGEINPYDDSIVPLNPTEENLISLVCSP